MRRGRTLATRRWVVCRHRSAGHTTCPGADNHCHDDRGNPNSACLTLQDIHPQLPFWGEMGLAWKERRQGLPSVIPIDGVRDQRTDSVFAVRERAPTGRVFPDGNVGNSMRRLPPTSRLVVRRIKIGKMQLGNSSSAHRRTILVQTWGSPPQARSNCQGIFCG